MSARLGAWMLAVTGLLLTAAVAGGCGDETEPPPPPQGSPSGAPAGSGAPAPPPAHGAADAGAGADGGDASTVPADLPPLPVREFQEADFVESDRSRDPFRPFTSVFVQQAKVRTANQRQVLIDSYALDELKLLGIVTRAPARALLSDPTGLGFVAKVGDFVGKAELVHTGGPTGVDVAINWRIDRIRESDVIFIREDAAHPEIPPTTRVMALHPLEDERRGGRGR